jgi:hypothetical protein
MVICPKCGENNAENFRFCGMCGAVLERATPPRAPKLETVRESAIPVALTIPANPPKAGAEKPARPISGPSVLGIGEPTLDSLRDKEFSGAEPFFEPEEPKTSGRKILLLLLLAALGVATWWTYTNYIAIGEGQKQQAASKPVAEKPAVPEPVPQPSNTDTAKSNPSAPAPTPAPEAAEKSPENVNPESKPEVAATGPAAKPREKEGTDSAAPVAKTNQRSAARNDRSSTPKPALTVTAADTGEAAFRKGEAYLYGRGVPENCDEAIKNLKAASAKLHARARSTFGTMYATGHCVPRDLPTSYSWFALALQVDPNNQILEKDLSAIWNQMTPPERQLATKLRQ